MEHKLQIIRTLLTILILRNAISFGLNLRTPGQEYEVWLAGAAMVTCTFGLFLLNEED